MTRYLVLQALEVQNANIYTTAFLLNGAPLLPAYFLAQNLVYQERIPSFQAVALIVHSIDPLGEIQAYGQFNFQQRRAAAFTFNAANPFCDSSSKNKKILSFQPVACAHMNVSIIIACQGLRSTESTEAFLEDARFAGGTVVGYKDVRLTETPLQGFSTGFLVIDRHDLLTQVQGKEKAERFLALLEQKHTLSASCVGYATISPFEKREGAREGYIHAFAEPLVGIVEYRSVHAEEKEKDAFWQGSWIRDDVFLLTKSHDESHGILPTLRSCTW